MSTNPSAMPEKTRTEDLPLISVIVPVYKVERYVDRCIQSIVDQTYRNLEIILVDDGSPDRCPQICDSFAQKDDRVFVIHKHNGGLSSARNAGLEKAHGAFIGFVDSDDYIASDMYESMLTNLQKEDADIAFTSSAHVYEDGSISTKHLVQGQYLVLNTEEAFKYINLPGYFGIAAWDKLVKRELLNEICFPENVVRDEDYGFSYKLLDRARKIVYDSTPKYYYRQSQGTLSNAVSSVSSFAADQALEMVNLVRKKYPNALPFALYGCLLVMMGIWDQVIAANNTELPNWKLFRKQMITYIVNNQNIIFSSVQIGKIRKIQIMLLKKSPAVYKTVFKFYKKLHPRRIG